MKHRKALVVMLAWVAFPACPSCSQELCTTEAVPGVVVHVQDGATRMDICDATVRLSRGGGDVETVGSAPGGDGCFYAGAHETTGTYDITVERAGYAPATVDNVTVGLGECHVNTQERTVLLERR